MNTQRAADTLGMSEKEMRALGHQMVDMVIDHLVGRSDEPAIQVANRADLEAVIGGPVPQGPSDAAAALRMLHSQVLPMQQHGDHPRYFARVPSPAAFTGILGDWLGTGFNTIATSWVGGSGPAVTELVVIDWLRQCMGMPEGTQGIVLSGGSMANFTAFAAAFASKGRGMVYMNDQTHASLKRNLTATGVDAAEIRVLKTNAQQEFDLQELSLAIAADRQAGKRPVMIIGNAGTTNTGAVDPLREIAALAKNEDMWLHLDGAYGGPAAMTAKGANALAGMELADSLVIDPHKWLFQPYDCGVVLVRHPGALERAFTMNPEYLKDVMGGEERVDLFNRSLELSRKTRALKLWLTFKTHGFAKISASILAGIELAERAQAMIEAQPQVWELASGAKLGIVTFVRRGAGSGDHARLVGQLTDDGWATISSTMIGERSVLRLCTLNPLTTDDDLLGTLARLAAMSVTGK
jgi:aromatic-L-amino-acid decarboxylase